METSGSAMFGVPRKAHKNTFHRREKGVCILQWLFGKGGITTNMMGYSFRLFELSAPRRPQHIKVTRKKVLREEYEHWELVHNGWVG